MARTIKQDKQELEDLFGEPREAYESTGYFLGGSAATKIVDSKGQETGYMLGGSFCHQRLNPEGEIIAQLGGLDGHEVLTRNFELTGYVVGGHAGSEFLYLRPLRNLFKLE
jgi:hypothetical protein